MSEAMTTAIGTAFTAVKTDVCTVIEKALPVGLGIMAITLAITLGVRFFKKVSK